jgi:rhodanese-related sulfurtransferase
MMTPQEAKALVDAGNAVIVDVREANELAESGIVEGAIFMPTSEMDDDFPRWVEFKKNLPKDKRILLYCRSGTRSGRVTEFLKEAGFDAANMGGFAGWKAAGLPTTPWKE